MAYDTRFGSLTQTPAQRALMLMQQPAARPSLKTVALARRLQARYVAGELSWLTVRPPQPPSP